MPVDAVVRKLRAIFTQKTAETELAEELTLHVALQTKKHVESGMSETEARRAALIEFGSLVSAGEECRETDRWAALDAATRNIKYAARSLWRNRPFAAVAIAILATGVGSTLAVGNLLNALLFRSIPVANARELVRISILNHGQIGTLPSTFVDALRTLPEYRGVCGFDTGYPGVEVGGSITSVGTLGFSGDCFGALGIGIQLGRGLAASDDQAGAAPVAVITDAFWQRQFNRRRDALSQQVHVDDQVYTVVGVAEARFTGLLVGFPAGLILPGRQQYQDRMPNGKKPTYWWVNILARRAAGISEQEAAARLKVRTPQLLNFSLPSHFSPERRRSYLASKLTATPGRTGVDYFLRERFGGSLYAAVGICLAILLIGCTNLMSLLLARGLKRRREIVMRFALGARKGQIAGLLAAEGFLLIAVGVSTGTLLAWALDKWLVSEGARMFGNFNPGLSSDWRIAGWCGVALLALGVAVAGYSLWQADAFEQAGVLKQNGRGILTGSGPVQKALLGFQIALTLALVAGSGMFSASLKRLNTIHLGVITQNVWDIMLSNRPGMKAYFVRGHYYREMLDEIRRIPGVEAASLTDAVPFFTLPEPESIAINGVGRAKQEIEATVISTSAAFLSTLGMRLIAGTGFEEREGGQTSVLISKSLALELSKLPEELIGHRLRAGADSRYQDLSIAGVVSDAKLDLAHPEQSAPAMAYVNIWQHPDTQGYPVLLIKTAKNSFDVNALRKIVGAKGREYVYRVRSLNEERDGALVESRLLAYLSDGFSAIALAMAATGLFGILIYQVSSRTGEIGVRIALGAQRGQIQWMVVRQVVVVLAVGSGVGLGLSLLVGRMIAGLLFGVDPYSPWRLVYSLGVLSAAAGLAAWLPARRASSVDPIRALRHE